MNQVQLNKLFRRTDLKKFWRKLPDLLNIHFYKYFYVFLCIYIVIKFQPFKLVPDFLKLNEIGLHSIFSNILSVISSIFGIFLAVIILGYEISKSKIGKHADLTFRASRDLQYLSSLLISILSIALIEYSTNLSSTSNSLTVAYFFGIINIMQTPAFGSPEGPNAELRLYLDAPDEDPAWDIAATALMAARLGAETTVDERMLADYAMLNHLKRRRAELHIVDEELDTDDLEVSEQMETPAPYAAQHAASENTNIPLAELRAIEEIRLLAYLAAITGNVKPE